MADASHMSQGCFSQCVSRQWLKQLVRSLANIVRTKIPGSVQKFLICATIGENWERNDLNLKDLKYREVNNITRCMKKAKENWIGEQCSEIEENLREKNNELLPILKTSQAFYRVSMRFRWPVIVVFLLCLSELSVLWTQFDPFFSQLSGTKVTKNCDLASVTKPVNNTWNYFLLFLTTICALNRCILINSKITLEAVINF